MVRSNFNNKFLRSFAALLAILSMVSVSFAQQQGKAATRGEKYKQKIVKLGVGHSILVESAGKRAVSGHIAEIKDSSVVIDEVDLKTKIEIAYDDITYVEGNYGGKGITGARVRPKRANILFIAGIAAIVGIAVAVAASAE